MIIRTFRTLLFLVGIAFSVIFVSCQTVGGPGAGPTPSETLSPAERNLVGTWGGRFAGVIVGLVYYHPDGTYSEYHKNSGRVKGYKGKWRVENGILEHNNKVSYRIVSNSGSRLKLKATSPTRVGFDEIEMRRYSSSTEVLAPEPALAQIADDHGFNDPIDFQKWADAAREANEAMQKATGYDPSKARPRTYSHDSHYDHDRESAIIGRMQADGVPGW